MASAKSDVTIKAFGNRVLIEQAKAEEVVGKIIVPDGAKKKPLKGKVIHVGAWEAGDSKLLSDLISIGQTVYYTAYAGTEIVNNGVTYLVINADDILAVEET